MLRAGAQPLRRQDADAGPGPTSDIRTALRPWGHGVMVNGHDW